MRRLDNRIIYFITNPYSDKPHVVQAKEACDAGVDIIQLRNKGAGYNELLREAEEIANICNKSNTMFIVNDNIDAAINSGADGVHLGKQDLSVTLARKQANGDFIVGATANSFEDIEKAKTEGATYIGLGPFRFTATKKNLSPELGSSGYARILEQMKDSQIDIPVYAIGGITPHDVGGLLNTGVHGCALSSVVSESKNVEETINILRENITIRK